MKNYSIFMKNFYVLICCLLLPFASVHAESYSYDAAGRLVGVTYDDGTAISYTYDNSGTIINRNVVGGSSVVLPTSPPSIDLLLAMTDSPDPIRSGQNITYTLSVTNNGPDVATNVEIYDTLPLTVTFVSAASSQGSCTQAGRAVFCAVGSMANTAIVTVTIVVTATTSGMVSNTATGAVPGSLDPIVSNNSATQITTVQADTDGDGVVDILDAFPLDPAASVDTDGDGIPDAWNVNATAAQIAASKLVLDPAPTIAEQFPYPDFGHLPLAADGGWHQSIDFAAEGGVSLKSDVISHNQVAAIEHTSIFTGSALKFSYKVSSESRFDFLRFYIDGVEQNAWSGEKGWATVSYPLADGLHTLKWAYEKDSAVTRGADAAWIDGVFIGADTDRDGISDTFDAFLSDPAASVDTDGDGHPDQWNIAATSAQIAQSSLTLDAYPNNANLFLDDIPPVITPPVNITVAPTDAMLVSVPINAFLTAATAVDIPDGQIFTISNDAPGVLPMGVTTVTFTATDSAGNSGTASASVTVQEPAAELFPSAGNLPAGWVQTAGTNGSWHVASDSSNTGLFSMRSDTITHNQLASIETTGTFVAGTIRFSYRVSSEARFDFLRFYIDNIEQGAWSGEKGWTTVSFPVVAGIHTLKWEYSKDSSASKFSDTAWIDDVILPLISVTDQLAPVVTAPSDVTAAAMDINGAAASQVVLMSFLAAATATDNVAVVGSITHDAPSVFPLGATTVTFVAIDAAGNRGTATALVTVTDQTNPAITLLSASPITIAHGSTYTDAGATALDNVDGNITANIVTVNPVDAAIVGTYAVTYNVSDAATNAATQVTRTVNVTDQTAPVITLLGTTPLTIAQGAIYNDAGATALDNVDGNISANIAAINPVNTATVGTYTVTYNISDAATNAATQVTRTVNITDQTAPVITLNGVTPVTIAQGSAYNDAGATAADNVDGVVTVITSGAVNAAAAGVYILTYTATDVANNSAIATRKIKVTAPGTTAGGTTAQVPISGSTTTVDIVSANEVVSNFSAASTAGTTPPAGVSFPFGIVSYTTSVTPNASQTVNLAFSSPLPANTVLYKVDNAGVYSLIPNGAGVDHWTQVNANTVALTLSDGGQFDLDNAPGVIIDPVAVGNGGGTSVPFVGGGGGCAIVVKPNMPVDPSMPVLVLLSMLWLAMHQKYRGRLDSSRVLGKQ